MPRFFFNLRDGKTVIDPEGLLLPGKEEALREALRGARDIMAWDVRAGLLRLKDRIEVVDGRGEPVLDLAFRDALKIEQ